MTFLRRFWEGWKRFGHFMGDLFGRLVLTIFYFTIFMPFGLIVTLFSDRLDAKNRGQVPAWRPRHTHDETVDDARRLA